MALVEPGWVCLDCTKDRKAKAPMGHIATFHRGICGICGEKKHVTQPRDFGRDRHKLRIKEDDNKKA